MFRQSRRRLGAARTRRRILTLLKQEGPSNPQSLAPRLGISAVAVRHHLYALREQGLVSCRGGQPRFGRPANVWQLKPAADSLFPDSHAALTVSLIDATRRSFGEEGLARILTARVEEQHESFRAGTPHDGSLRERVKTLARLRTADGFMADVRHAENDALLLIENHCPVRTAASACAALCSAELELFQSVLGPDVEIERTEHILSGARRCVYSIKARRGQAAPVT